MSLNKTLLLIAIGLATGCSNQAHQAALAAERASANSQPPETIGAAAAGYRRAINRSIDEENGVACYTIGNGNGGNNISCVKLN